MTMRVFLAFMLLAGLSSYWSFTSFEQELKPAIKKTSEEALVDAANLLAELIAENSPENTSTTDFASTLDVASLKRVVHRFSQRQIDAEIWSVRKSRSNLNFYITDHRGTVIFDSQGQALGQDYSRWNDVYLTLNGQYGARSTNEGPKGSVSLMHVAAPIIRHDQLVGVITLVKPDSATQPFFASSIEAIKLESIVLFLASLILAGLLSWYLTRAIRLVAGYIKQLESGRTVKPPQLNGQELQPVVDAVANLHKELAGKAYVERYVQSLTHELKSPVAAISGAAELLALPMSASERDQFIDNIARQSQRLDETIGKMLELATIENASDVINAEILDVPALIQEVIEITSYRLHEKKIDLNLDFSGSSISDSPLSEDSLSACSVSGDAYQIRQAIENMLINAIDFSEATGRINIASRLEQQGQQRMLVIRIEDFGCGIPEYAQTRIFDRFYSLKRPGGDSSTGLGLNFSKQVAQLHQGSLTVANKALGSGNDSGVVAELSLPSL